MLTTKEVQYFSQFSDFTANVTKDGHSNIQRLAAQRNWPAHGKTYKKHLKALRALQAEDEDDDLAGHLDLLSINFTGRKVASKPSTSSGTVQAAFAKIAKTEGLTRKTTDYDDRFAQYLADEVRAHYGTKDFKLHILQDLCRDAKIDVIPESVKGCRAALNKVYINIFDFLNCKRAGKEVAPVFRKRYDFVGRTWKIGTFKLEWAKQSPILRFLLKELTF